MPLRPLSLERVLDVVSDIFVVFDKDFRLVYHNEANRAAMRDAGLDPEGAIGKHVLEAFPRLSRTDGLREARRTMDERVPTQWEESYGPDVCLRGRAFPADDGGIIVVATNITKEQRALDAERAARAAAEAANRAKSDFLAAMSHELRTPLNAIGGYTDLLGMGLRGALTEQQKEDIRRIARNQAHLLSIINDILNFARLEAGAIRMNLAPVSAHEVVTGVEPLLSPQIAEKQIMFSLEACDPAVMMQADRDKVQQVLLNLLVNAAKFTRPGGSIRLGVDCDKGTVRIHVRDTGVGIPSDKLESIFEPFVQAHRTLTQPTPGTGLGLAISRDLARRMGGDVTVQSQVGIGSTFTLSLPRS